MSLANDLDRKFFHALLNGLTQGFIYGKADISLIYLQEQLFGSSSMKPAGQVLLMEELLRLLRLASSQHLTLDALEAELRQVSLAEEQIAVFLMFWKTERPKIHDLLVSQSSWEPTLEQLSWRVDVKTAARGVADHSQPTAIVEMSLGHGKAAAPSSVFQFELNRAEVDDVLQTIDAIQRTIKEATVAPVAASPVAAAAAAIDA